VDDYWIEYLSTEPDPWITNGWAEHTHEDCTGDFMGTNQSEFDNIDGSTTFYYYVNGDPLYDFTDLEPDERDGGHGLKLFAESRGYSVVTNFNQYIQGQGSDPSKGFTFDDFMAEIDAGRPVLIHVEGHTMLGYAYDTAGDTVYIHDTWDYSAHQMTWGGSYSGSQHFGVSVIQLAAAVPPSVTTNDASDITDSSATLNGNLGDWGTASDVHVSFEWGETTAYGDETTPEAMPTTGPFSFSLPSLSPDTTYHFIAKAVGDGTSYGDDRSFTTESAASNPPNAPASPLCEGVTNPTGVTDPTPEFSWTFSDPDGGDTQGAYQILVDSNSGNLASDNGDMWDSTKVGDSASEVSYAGTTLAENQTYYWKVKTWDNHDAEGSYCSEQQFTTGSLPPGLLRVETSPAVPTTVSVDGIPRNNWGLDWVKMPAGEYTLSFTDVPGFLTPTEVEVTYYPPGGEPVSQPLSQPVEVLADVTTVVVIHFIQLGYLRVEIGPVLPVPPTIFVDGNPMNDWGLWVSLEAGEYTVSFQEMDGYQTPPPTVVTVNPGETTHVTGNDETGETTVNP